MAVADPTLWVFFALVVGATAQTLQHVLRSHPSNDDGGVRRDHSLLDPVPEGAAAHFRRRDFSNGTLERQRIRRLKGRRFSAIS
ncbi:hypothetical protein [Ilumatobacter sp.]|uniref:hypothetical protein n=1 Tax=Ilumatobacter sp. TaxID=1967498 RepID=UPI003750661E